MKLVVISHKPCWTSPDSPTGHATNGGFPLQMQALSELFDQTTLILPFLKNPNRTGEMPLVGKDLSVIHLTSLAGTGLSRKLRVPFWVARNLPILSGAILRADAVHAPIPGDIGTIGQFLALLFRKPLFVRHCGNWLNPETVAERFWKRFMEHLAGGRNVMLATGGALQPPSPRNPAVQWIFSTSLTEDELKVLATCRQSPKKSSLRLIIVARQERAKGADTVIQSLPLLCRDFPQIAFDVVGDGGALKDLKQLAASSGVSDRITFHGNVDHSSVICLLRRADLFCFPTRSSDGFPKAVLEALACGLPVVTTRVSVLPLLIGKGGGVLVDEATPGALAKAISYCLSNTERYAAMSARAVEIAREYSLQRWRDTIGSFLQAAWGPLRTDG